LALLRPLIQKSKQNDGQRSGTAPLLQSGPQPLSIEYPEFPHPEYRNIND
jgi:hypothetical protein